jgi:23S rRNA (pseudouridine1915-N3)-methyltransferase
LPAKFRNKSAQKPSIFPIKASYARGLMFKIKVYSVGKTKENWLQEALSIYEERLKSSLRFEWILAKSETQLKQFLEKETDFICLDPKGKPYSSKEFSFFLTHLLQERDSRLSFAIGGAEGFTTGIREKAKYLISFSRMTFTHQLTRLILVEQIYRALEIQKKSAYHK